MGDNHLVVSRNKTEITPIDTVYLVIFNLIYGLIHGSVDSPMNPGILYRNTKLKYLDTVDLEPLTNSA